MNTTDLIVYDLKAVEGTARYQPTNSWTRGAQFVMAGGVMGILAAINDEVERGHVANIILIFVIILVLHSITYNSIPSGFIILTQIATATMLSLAYMAVTRSRASTSTRCRSSRWASASASTTRSTSSTASARRWRTPRTSTKRCRRAVRTTGHGGELHGHLHRRRHHPLGRVSNLRFQAEMAQLLSILMVINMLGAITIVPSLYSIFRPKVAMALLTAEQLEAIRAPEGSRAEEGPDRLGRAGFRARTAPRVAGGGAPSAGWLGGLGSRRALRRVRRLRFIPAAGAPPPAPRLLCSHGGSFPARRRMGGGSGRGSFGTSG